MVEYDDRKSAMRHIFAPAGNKLCLTSVNHSKIATRLVSFKFAQPNRVVKRFGPNCLLSS